MNDNVKPKTVDAYIAQFPEAVREKLQALRRVMRGELPGAEEVISYQMPAFRLDKRNVIYFAAWKDHLSLYPFSASVQKMLEKECALYQTSGRGTIRFPLDQPLPRELIRRIVQLRLAEMPEKEK